MSSAPSVSTSDLAALLVRMAREKGQAVERMRAEQLVADARIAWPGEPERQAPKWLGEAARSLGLRPVRRQVSLEAAIHLVEDGALLVTGGAAPMVLLGCERGRVVVAQGDLDHQTHRTREELSNALELSHEHDNAPLDWLVIEDLDLSHTATWKLHDRPTRRLWALLQAEWSDIGVVTVFAFVAGILSLATPIAVESLVNTVTFGRLVQPLVILSLVLFGFLAFAALMQSLQTFVVEIIQRRLFARVAADLAYRFPRVQPDSLHGAYGPELANRFFDIVTLQKVVAQLLLDGVGIVLTTFVGMAVLAFYHPWLLGFDVLLLLCVVGGLLLLGRGAVSSGIDESKQKYRLASWLEDLIRCHQTFKLAGGAEFALDRANFLTGQYLESRKRHFSKLFGQLLYIFGLQAVAGTVLLGFGGWLVIREEMNLGQLVAAELIVATILGSLAKLGKHIEGFYDVVASVDKLGHLFDLDIEPQDGLLSLRAGAGAAVKLTDVCLEPPLGPKLSGVTLDIEPGDRLALVGATTYQASLLLDMLFGIRYPEKGHIEIEETDPRDLRPDVLRGAVALSRGVELFEGTVAENVHMHRARVSMTDVRNALADLGLLDEVLRLPDGLDTRLNATGAPLGAAQCRLLVIARAIASRPRLLLIDGQIDPLGDARLERVLQALTAPEHPWTLVVATSRRDVAVRLDRIMEIDPGDRQADGEALPSEGGEA